MLWRIKWEDLQFESPNKYHKRAGSRLTLSQVPAPSQAPVRGLRETLSRLACISPSTVPVDEVQMEIAEMSNDHGHTMQVLLATGLLFSTVVLSS